jgi:solute carrier family 35 (UDP-sugar transporter), member A1/2/3
MTSCSLNLSLSLRNTILLALCAQNAGFTLLRRYSQGVLKQSYDYSSLLLVGEVIKLLSSAYVTAYGHGTTDDTDLKHLSGLAKLSYLARHSTKMLLLSVIYGVMNIFSFISLARISAVEFTVASQLKILVTAIFFVLLFQRKISPTKWRALILLVLGVVLVADPDHMRVSERVTTPKGGFDIFVGYSAVLIQVALSGFAAVYFEKVIKSSSERLSIWDRNFQLAGCSILFYFGTYLFGGKGSTKSHHGFFAGWTIVTFFLSVLSAAGGILVAMTFKYADSILKTLAVSLAIVVTTFFSWAFMGAELNVTMTIGALSAVLGVVNYNWDSTPTQTFVAPGSPKQKTNDDKDLVSKLGEGVDLEASYDGDAEDGESTAMLDPPIVQRKHA